LTSPMSLSIGWYVTDNVTKCFTDNDVCDSNYDRSQVGEIEPPDPNLFGYDGRGTEEKMNTESTPYCEALTDDECDVKGVHNDGPCLEGLTKLMQFPVDWVAHSANEMQQRTDIHLSASDIVTALYVIYRTIYERREDGLTEAELVHRIDDDVPQDQNTAYAYNILRSPLPRYMVDAIRSGYRDKTVYSALRPSLHSDLKNETWLMLLLKVLLMMRLLGRTAGNHGWLLFAWSSVDPELQVLKPLSEASVREYVPLSINYLAIRNMSSDFENFIPYVLWYTYCSQKLLATKLSYEDIDYFKVQQSLVNVLQYRVNIIAEDDFCVRPLPRAKVQNSVYVTIDGNLNYEFIRKLISRVTIIMKLHPGISLMGLTKRIGLLFESEVNELIVFLITEGVIEGPNCLV